MRLAALALALALPVPALAQSAPLSADLSSGLGSGLEASLGSGLGAGIESGLGSDMRRTMADGYFRGDRNAGALNGGGCAPTQINLDGAGCQPFEALRNRGNNPDRQIGYFANDALGPVNQMPTYRGDSAFRSTFSTSDPNRPF